MGVLSITEKDFALGLIKVRKEPKMKETIWGAFSVILLIAFVSCKASSQAVPTSTDGTGLREEVITMQITVQVSADVARALYQRGPPTAESEELLRIMNTFGIKLEPLHRNTYDPSLQRYFIVEVPDRATAQQVMDRLQQLEAVEAAYVKPPDELP